MVLNKILNGFLFREFIYQMQYYEYFVKQNLDEFNNEFIAVTSHFMDYEICQI